MFRCDCNNMYALYDIDIDTAQIIYAVMSLIVLHLFIIDVSVSAFIHIIVKK